MRDMARARKLAQPDKVTKPTNGFSVRPSKAFRPLIQQLAAQDHKSEGQFVNECAEAIVRMILAEEEKIPWLVTKMKALRGMGITALSPERPFTAERDSSDDVRIKKFLAEQSDDEADDAPPRELPLDGADAGF